MKKNELFKKVLFAILCPNNFILMLNWTFILTFLICIKVSANSYSQNVKINLDLKNVPLKEAFSVLEKKGNIRILFIEEDIPNTLITIKAENTPVIDVLDKIIKVANLKYSVHENGLITVTPLTLQIDESANILVRGQVTDSKDVTLPGVSIQVKGTSLGTVTDTDGKFSISVPPTSILIFSYIGYVSQEIPVNNQNTINVSLETDAKSLNEVVVTGYTTQRKKDISGSVAIVNIGDATKIPATSSEQLLQGQAAGVTVINQGAPGASSTVFIRGISNFGNSSPLYVIDGVQINSMSQINPTDIESISVLKDAGAAAIYGISGGNGVIVITTKKGKSGKPTINYDGYYGTQQPLGGNVWHLLNPTQQSQLAFLANDQPTEFLYPGGPGSLPTYGYQGGSAAGSFGSAGSTTDPSITKYYHFDASNPGNDFLVQKFNQQGTDWFHEIFKAAPEQQHTLTASGGSDKSTYLFSLNYVNQQGTLIDTYEKRYTARLNTNFNIKDHIRFGENGYIYYRDNNGGSSYNNQSEGNAISYTYREMPIIPVYDIAGNYGGGYDAPAGKIVGIGANPVAIQARTVNNYSRYWNIQGNIFAEADIAKYFTVRTSIGGNVNNNYYYGLGYNPYENAEGHSIVNSAYEGSLYTSNYNWTNTILYHQTFGKHKVQVFAGYEQKASSGRQIQGNGTSYFSMDPNYLQIQYGTANDLPVSYIFQPYSTESVFGRLDYSYNDKYILGATLRRDGYSAFYPGRQWGTFPSVSLAWRISQEDFLKGVSWINDLKLRGSYGLAGNNSNIGGSNAYSQSSSGTGASYYGITGSSNSITQGFYQSSIGNPKTTWETDKILNVAFDATLFNHLDLNVEYYKKSISGLLFQLPLAATVGGASAPYVNVGDVQNKGFDIAATYHGKVNKDISFSIGANITTYHNIITSLPSGSFTVASSRDNNIVREKVGDPIGEFYGYKVVGIYQNASQVSSLPGYSGALPGSFIYQDVNGDGKIDANDRTDIGNPNPKFTYGLNLNATYKRFDFTMVLYGSSGNKDFNYVKYWTDFYSTFQGGKSLDLLNNSAIVSNGVVTNPGATLPSAAYAQAMGSSTISSYYVENGSFLKCRVLQIGYTFDPSALKRIGFDKLHIYAQGTNLFTITKYSGLDPELVPSVNNLNDGNQSAAFGIDYGAYPNNQKQYILGVNLTF